MDSSELREWQKHIREALNHLHDPTFLRKSPLGAAFDVSARFDTPAAIRRVLVEAIEALEPQAEAPPGSRAWEVFQSVYYRYVEQFSQGDVAHQMGVSARQLRRLQRSALEALAYRLAEQYDLQGPGLAPHEIASSANDAGEDLEWLRTSPPEETTDLNEAVPAAVALLRPLATQRGVSVETALPGDQPCIAAHPVAVRQALLNVLTVAVLNALPSPGPTVRIVADVAQGRVRVTCHWQAAEPLPDRGPAEDQDRLAFAQRLATLCSGNLRVESRSAKKRAVFTFSALAQRLVLAIDDNVQALQLLQRYAVGTRYRVIGARDLPEAQALMQAYGFEVIVVDVMMPQTDGWTILADLRQNPLTVATPVVVCTVLPQRELALSLGANDFLQKPLSRQAFLQALDRQISP